MKEHDPLWYKDAIIYEVHVKSFFDSNDDGIGDFEGLTAKLDYLRDLGVTAIWVLPFYPSPLRDDGYDIADYRNIHASYGSLRDFRRFVRAAHAQGIRVITELVVNHTSDQHRWFQRARHAKPGSVARNFYVWSDDDKAFAETRIIFTDTEASNWAWDPVAGAYYWHRFFSHQPDLNFDNPQVLKAIVRNMIYWLDMGVDGMRLDAVPYLCEREGTNNENLPETHEIIRRIRAALDDRYADRMLLAEANQWPEDVLPYFGEGDECHMAYHFPLMPRIYMALAQEDRHPVTDIIRQTPDIPANCQWAIFLRNHDELTLEMVTDRERDYLWSFYAADPRAKLNLGIRRRLAPLLDNDRRKIELLNGLLMSMQGTPIIYYGDEIGMGDNIYLGDRDGVRTPMQWGPDRNGGFSRADPARLYLPPIMDPVYGFASVNVEAQSRSTASLLSWMKRLITVRKGHLAFSRGTLEILYPANRKALAYLREHDGEIILCLANLSRASQPVELDLSRFRGRVPIELLGGTAFPKIGDLPYFITLQGYGFHWFLLADETDAPSWHEPAAAPLPELMTLVLPRSWDGTITGEPRELLERRILLEFLPSRRWFAAKDRRIAAVRMDAHAMLRDAGGRWMLALPTVTIGPGTHQLYALPLAVDWEEGAEDPVLQVLPLTLARVRQGARLGVLYDAMGDERFVRAVLRAISTGTVIEAVPKGEVAFIPSRAFEPAMTGGDPAVHPVSAEQSNSSVTIGDRMILKLYRHLQSGIHPEVEMGRYLTETVGYANAPALLGHIEYRDGNGATTMLGVVHALVQNQGDGWTYTVDYLDRMLEEAGLVSPESFAETVDRYAAYTALIETLGRRVGELHRALAQPADDQAFQPEPIAVRDIAAWGREIRTQTAAAFRVLRGAHRTLTGATRESVGALLKRRAEVDARVDALLPRTVEAIKTRYHGDLHLGQVIVAQNDFYIIDFEGEPARQLAGRRGKNTPLRDVAGMLRSFNYAAWSCALNRAEGREASLDLLLPQAIQWAGETADAFMSGYRAAIADSAVYPQDERVAERLIRLFMVEKALYEICYEATNRPDWLRIPVQGVLDELNTRD